MHILIYKRYFMKYYATLQDKLTTSLNPISLDILDESYKHKGHAGYREGLETHFHVKIVSEHFTDMPKVQRHRLIYKILKQELADQIHALAIDAYAPGEIS